jgi:uncharacterized protein (DUF58 family)
MARLFSDQFIRSVAQLRIVARQVPTGGRHAEQRSQDRGGGMEFRDFRAYVPGDDLRRVDWNVYRRSGRLFLRLFEQPEDLPVYILLDVSGSMFFEAPPRADAARQMAGLLTVISLGQLDRVSIYPLGRDLGDPFRPTAGPQGQHAALAFLEALRPAGPTDLGRALRRFAALELRGGLAAIISDFFDPRGPTVVTDALRALRHRLLLVQLARDVDGEPTLDGELTLADCETDAELEVAVTPAALQRYRTAYRRFCEHLLGFAAKRQAAHLRLNAEQPVLTQIGELFRNRTFVT